MALTRRQQQIANTIVQVGRRHGASRKEILAALETARVESNFSNPKGGDRDSSGWRQERASSYPGKNRTNVRAAARRFYSETAAAGRGRGMSAGRLAQSVQRSAYPARYDAVKGEVKGLLHGAGTTVPEGKSIPGVDRSQDRKRILASILLSQNGINVPSDPLDPTSQSATTGTDLTSALLQIARTKDTPAKTVKGGSTVRGHGSVTKAAGADRPGVKTSKKVIRFADKVSAQARRPVTIGTGTNHSRTTVSGNVSDHWSGHAGDIPASGRRLIRLGRAALVAAGMPKAKARRINGGLFNVGGHQIIFNTHEGGDHTDHLHISA